MKTKLLPYLSHARDSLPRIDWLIVLPVLTLASLSLLILFSIKLPVSAQRLDFSPWHQLIFVGLGIGIMLFLSRFDYRLLKRWSPWIYLLSIILLGFVLYRGDTAGGAERWITIASIRFQPAELAKAALIILLARVFTTKERMHPGYALTLTGLYVAIPVVLIMLQPDLSTAAICVMLWIVMALRSSIPRQIVASGAGLILAVTLISMPLLADYQRARLLSFLQPSHDLSGVGYNSQQALITVGSGGLWGQGLSGGSQSQLMFLPEQHTDFIFAVVAEKLGFIGVLILLIAMSCLILRLLLLATHITDTFGAYLLAGIIVLLASQFMINVGMNIGLLPVTGLPLPFMSYGGTHTIVGYGLVGIALSIIHSQRQLSYKHSR